MQQVNDTKMLADPRVRRTRLLLQEALERLLAAKDFNRISVQDVAEAAEVNRATFYDHYSDKFALLESVVGTRFNELLRERHVDVDGGCSGALRAIVLAVCDYLATAPRPECAQMQLEPHLERAVIAVVRELLLTGMQQHPLSPPAPPEMAATAAAWAIYGAAKAWLLTSEREPSEHVAGTIDRLVRPLLGISG